MDAPAKSDHPIGSLAVLWKTEDGNEDSFFSFKKERKKENDDTYGSGLEIRKRGYYAGSR